MFKIMIVSGPAEQYIEQCLCSVCNQTVKDWQAQVVLDPAGDNTYTRALNVKDSRISIKLNDTRQYNVANYLEATRLLNPKDDDIMVQIDGDDWLATSSALEIVRRYYDGNPQLLLTHGSWTSVPNPNCPKNNFPYTESDFKTGIRRVQWRASHLRTFKYKVWRCVKDSDLRDSSGKYYTVTGDLAMIWPMVEMAGYRRVQFIPEILYVYNQGNPHADVRVRLRDQMRTADYIASRPSYTYRETF